MRRGCKFHGCRQHVAAPIIRRTLFWTRRAGWRTTISIPRPLVQVMIPRATRHFFLALTWRIRFYQYKSSWTWVWWVDLDLFWLDLILLHIIFVIYHDEILCRYMDFTRWSFRKHYFLYMKYHCRWTDLCACARCSHYSITCNIHNFINILIYKDPILHYIIFVIYHD